MLRMLDLLQAQPFDLAILSTCTSPAWTATCWPDASATPVMRSGRYGFLPERRRQFAEPPLHAVRLDIREVLTVCARCALVGAALGPGVGQDVVTADLSYSA